ncbi:polyprenyl synthetase family protein [Streptomyces sp. NPDC088789]|uniref:polyprenyl synthetase family protein n=1 Tax=Streptomyces sp. NPDC088789 TaxID=3365899 RepID=UPI003811EB11
MRSTHAPGPPTAEVPLGPPAGPGRRQPPEPAGPPEASDVDTDVAGAVGREVRALLADRLAQCRELDPVFAHDIAERIARFTGRGGGRIRPRLLWWSLRACGGGEEAPQVRAALRTAAALDLIQTCALVHDDLMDRAAVRRGGPAFHTDVADQYAGSVSRPTADRLGTSAALLAGDVALAWADDALTESLLEGGLPRATTGRLHEVWRALRTEMAAGQYLDVQGQAAGVYTAARAVRAAGLKSARYSVERPLELGAVLAGADAATTRALCRAGRSAGLAFQLRDDLDDLFADPEVTGKPAGGDVREGKPTYLLTAARTLAAASYDRRALKVLERATGRADGAGQAGRAGQAGHAGQAGQAGLGAEELAEVRAAVVATGAHDLVRSRIARLTAQCLNQLGDAALEPVAAGRLRTLLTEITEIPPEIAGSTEVTGITDLAGDPPAPAARPANDTETSR